MRGKIGRPFNARIHVSEGDHRRGVWERSGNKEGKLVYEITNRLLARCSALVDLGRETILANPQLAAEETDFILFRFEEGQVLVGQYEIEEDKPGAYEVKRMALPVAEIVFIHPIIDSSGKEMKDSASAQMSASSRVPLCD